VRDVKSSLVGGILHPEFFDFWCIRGYPTASAVRDIKSIAYGVVGLVLVLWEGIYFPNVLRFD